MGFLRSIAAARLRTVSKLFAACLIALIVTPFTAPFAVCDFADFTQTTAAHGHALDEGKPSVEATDGVPAVIRFAATLRAGETLHRPAAARLEQRSPLVRVLRI